MSLVATEQLVRALTYQRNFYILSSAPRYEVHGNDRRCRNRFFQTFYYFREGAFKLGLVELYGYMPRAQDSCCLRCVRQLIVFERVAVAYRVCWPWPALFIHQR